MIHMMIVFGSVLQGAVVRWLPWSFSPGEGSLVSQGLLILMVVSSFHAPISSREIAIFLRVSFHL